MALNFGQGLFAPKGDEEDANEKPLEVEETPPLFKRRIDEDEKTETKIPDEDPIFKRRIDEDKPNAQELTGETKPIDHIFEERRDMLVNYDWIDIVSQQGYGVFYLCTGNDSSAATTYFVTSSKCESLPYYTTELTGNANSAVYEKKLDKDHDILVNTNITLKGKAIVNLTTYPYDNGYDFYYYFIVRLRKYSGISETEIASGKSLEYKYSNGKIRLCLDLGVTSEVSFKKGDLLRVTVEAWVKESRNIYNFIGYYHDPLSRYKLCRSYNHPTSEGDLIEFGESTAAIVNIPFKINI